MSEQEQQDKDQEKVYPGSLTRYTALRTAREKFGNSPEATSDPSLLMSLTVAEELAGLAYILDGIRYSARNK